MAQVTLGRRTWFEGIEYDAVSVSIPAGTLLTKGEVIKVLLSELGDTFAEFNWVPFALPRAIESAAVRFKYEDHVEVLIAYAGRSPVRVIKMDEAADFEAETVRAKAIPQPPADLSRATTGKVNINRTLPKLTGEPMRVFMFLRPLYQEIKEEVIKLSSDPNLREHFYHIEEKIRRRSK